MEHYYIGTDKKMKPEPVRFSKVLPERVYYSVSIDQLYTFTSKDIKRIGKLVTKNPYWVFVGTL